MDYSEPSSWSTFIYFIIFCYVVSIISGLVYFFVFAPKNTSSGSKNILGTTFQPSTQQPAVISPNNDQLILASQLAASQLAASQLAANQVAANQLAASQVAASQVAASQVAASQVAASQRYASQVAASQQYASQIAASQAAANKNIVVAYGEGGIAYTNDGINWNLCFKEIPNKGGCAGMTRGNGKYLAIFGGYTATSTDGINWSQGFSNHSGNIVSGGLAGGNGMWISVGYMNNFVSNDGVTWTSINDPLVSTNYTPGGAPGGVTYGNGMFQIASNIYQNNGSLIYYTKDAKTWTITLKQNNDICTSIYRILYGNGVWVAIGNPVSGTQTRMPIWYSNDGINWTNINYSPGSLGINGAPWLAPAAFGNGVFFIVGGTMPLYSKDGATWQPMPNWAQSNLNSMMFHSLRDLAWINNASSPTGGYWLAGGEQHHAGAYVLAYSADGCIWKGSPSGITGGSIYDNAGYGIFHNTTGFCNYST